MDCYLNLPEVKEALGVDPSVAFESCSAAVGDALGPDVMRSVARLVPDLLAARLPLLLYQGKAGARAWGGLGGVGWLGGGGLESLF